MTDFLTVSRASRLVGVTRITLQQKIQSGELETFDGRISINQLLCLYPEVCLERNDFMTERVERIKAEAIHHRTEPLTTATVETLTAMLEKRVRELCATQQLIDCCQVFYQELLQRVQALDQVADTELRCKINELHQWLINAAPHATVSSNVSKV